MNRNDETEMVVAAKLTKNLKWVEIANKIGLSKEWTTAALLGQMTLTKAQADIVGALLGLPAEALVLLQVVPYKGSLIKAACQRQYQPTHYYIVFTS